MIGCETAVDSSEQPAATQLGIPVGCWRLAGQRDEPTPDIIRLDSAVTRSSIRGDGRTVVRLDENGRVLLRDVGADRLYDEWHIDAKRDSLGIVLNNGYYGSVWTLALPARAGASEVMRGWSNAFTDVIGPPPYPTRTVTATRIACPVAADAAPGV